MHAPAQSLLLVFENLDPETHEVFQIGARIVGLPELAPGATYAADLAFWDDPGRVYATPDVAFKLRYAGRIVGSGRVQPDATGGGP